MTDQTGSTSAEKRSYDAFGARRNPSWGAAPVAFSSLTTRGFTGHEDDEELGLINMKGRLYDPKVGRFLTTDPLVSHPAFGQSWNPYSYVFNNPLAFTDPSGFETTDTTYSNGTRDVVFDSDRVVVRPPIGPPRPPPPPASASQAGVPTVPVDLGATGNKATSAPESTVDETPSDVTPHVQQRWPSTTTIFDPTFDPTFGKSTTAIVGEVESGAAAGVGDSVTDAMQIDLVHIPRGLFQIVGTAWRDGDPVGGLAALFWTPGRQLVDEQALPTRTVEGARLGTPLSMAPEQICATGGARRAARTRGRPTRTDRRAR